VNDGGYLLPKSEATQDVLVSPGVSWNSSFEDFFASQGTICHLFDASVENPQVMHSNFKFIEKFWGLEDNNDTINAPKWIAKNINPLQRNALQMDIEGAEYDLINAMPEKLLTFFNLIIIEVHNFPRLLERDAAPRYIEFFNRLTLHHRVVHFHPNNNIPPVKFLGIDVIECFELTLVRKDYPNFIGVDGNFSLHALDTPCVKAEREIKVNWDEIVKN
jgi:hypothetical protein